MVSIEQVEEGFAKYLDAELISKLEGWRRWVAGASLSLVLENGKNVFYTYKDNEFVKSLGVIDEEDNINIDSLYQHFSDQAKKSPASFTLPVIGTITLKHTDVDKLYHYIIGE